MCSSSALWDIEIQNTIKQDKILWLYRQKCWPSSFILLCIRTGFPVLAAPWNSIIIDNVLSVCEPDNTALCSKGQPMDAVRLNLIYNSTYHFSLFYFNIIVQLLSCAFQIVSSIMVLERIFSCRLFLTFLQEYYISFRVFIHPIIIGSTNCKASRLDFLQLLVTFLL